MTKRFISGGCSFTYGHELSDDDNGKIPSALSWAHKLRDECFPEAQYTCTARPGSGNSGIARRVFEKVVENPNDVCQVVVMWSFMSRYEWAMPRHEGLEAKRWAYISPWDISDSNNESFKILSKDAGQEQQFAKRRETYKKAGVTDLADAIYTYGQNLYHETYLSWKSIIWLQNILEKMNVPFFFTLADNSLFYNEMKPHKELDDLMRGMYEQIDITKWFSFGERMMGFNQWALLEDYARGVTHPLDEAHADAVKLMLPTFKKHIGGK